MVRAVSGWMTDRDRFFVSEGEARQSEIDDQLAELQMLLGYLCDRLWGSITEGSTMAEAITQHRGELRDLLEDMRVCELEQTVLAIAEERDVLLG